MKPIRPFWLVMLELLARLNEAWQECVTGFRKGYERARNSPRTQNGELARRVGLIAVYCLLLCGLVASIYLGAQSISNQDKNWEGVKFHCEPPLADPTRCRDSFERYMGNPRKPR